MRVVLDSNVVMSAIFWSGIPGRILEHWMKGRFQLLLSLEVFDEYQEIEERLSKKYDMSSGSRVLNQIFMGAHLVDAADVQTPPCDDPDDVMFLRLAIAGRADYLVSGDKHLLKVGSFPGGSVIKPSPFLSLFHS